MFRTKAPVSKSLEPEYPGSDQDESMYQHPGAQQALSNRAGITHAGPAVYGGRKTFADRLVVEAMRQNQPGCLMNMVSAAWVYLFHAIFRHREAVEKENDDIRMNLVQQDLAVCAAKLNERERELSSRVKVLTQEAVCRKKAGDLIGARKRLVDRKRVQNQLGQLSNSISVVEMHINTIEGSELNKSILQTLKASGDALRRMGVEGGGIEGVEKIVSEVEAQMEYASEITKVISTGNVAGTINSMGGDVFTEEELEQELEDLLLQDGDDYVVSGPKPPVGNAAAEAGAAAASVKKNRFGSALKDPSPGRPPPAQRPETDRSGAAGAEQKGAGRLQNSRQPAEQQPAVILI